MSGSWSNRRISWFNDIDKQHKQALINRCVYSLNESTDCLTICKTWVCRMVKTTDSYEREIKVNDHFGYYQLSVWIGMVMAIFGLYRRWKILLIRNTYYEKETIAKVRIWRKICKDSGGLPMYQSIARKLKRITHLQAAYNTNNWKVRHFEKLYTFVWHRPKNGGNQSYDYGKRQWEGDDYGYWFLPG